MPEWRRSLLPGWHHPSRLILLLRLRPPTRPSDHAPLAPLFFRLQPQNYDWQTTREIAAIEEGVEEEMTGESAAQHTPACLPVPA